MYKVKLYYIGTLYSQPNKIRENQQQEAVSPPSSPLVFIVMTLHLETKECSQRSGTCSVEGVHNMHVSRPHPG